MIPTNSDSLSRAVSCKICDNSLDLKVGQSSQREVVKTSCIPPHYFHLECIAQRFDPLLRKDRRCHVCNKQPLPLVRLSGVRLNETSPYCESLAPYACRTGNLAQLQELLGQDTGMVKQQYSYPTVHYETTLLSIAASFGQIECLKALINRGPKEQLELDTALEYAAKRGHIECVKLLLNEGATNVDSALICASQGGQAECVEVLIDNGANDFSAALFSSTWQGHTECLKVLFNRVKTFNINDLNNCLRCAAYNGRPETLQILIDNGADDLDGALYSSAMRGRSECLRILLLMGANSSVITLCCAAERGHVECLKLLVDNGTNDLYTPLRFAKKNNCIECQQILREKINSQQMGCTIL